MEDLGKDVGGEVHLWGILGERKYLVRMVHCAVLCCFLDTAYRVASPSNHYCTES